jgi:hypothetical protein
MLLNPVSVPSRSAYSSVAIDEMVFKTRVKQYTSNPFFEAPIEVFCRDFRDTVIRVVMRDSRLREGVSCEIAIQALRVLWLIHSSARQDPILGVVSLRAAEIFSEASSVTST